jgi:L,D-transpeptidase catalytic domain
MRFIARTMTALFALVAATNFAHAVVRIDIDLSTQSMRVVSDTGERYEWPISSGRRGHPTPHGVFRPIALYTMVHSAKYDNAPMPHSIFFHGGYAIHGTGAVWALGRPASHGCIRLAPGNAARLFALVRQEGAAIRISGGAPAARRDGETALGYAPRPARRTLRQWADDPLFYR